jgi:hypothetical protein
MRTVVEVTEMEDMTEMAVTTGMEVMTNDIRKELRARLHNLGIVRPHNLPQYAEVPPNIEAKPINPYF